MSQLTVGETIPPRCQLSQLKLKNSAHRNASRAAIALPLTRSTGSAASIKALHSRTSSAAMCRPSAQYASAYSGPAVPAQTAALTTLVARAPCAASCCKAAGTTRRAMPRQQPVQRSVLSLIEKSHSRRARHGDTGRSI
ncbi:hypothetical protein AB2N08_21160 [Massilia aurea]|uniref:hypothetical protein n=1 Tax=Massilia aurea TaxID=373040 RepID=UPI0034628EDA